ncbi:RNA-directed DNA polymerase, eukaryota [Tanacetum coccineum]
MNSRPLSSKECGFILDVMEEIIKVGQTMGYNLEGCAKNIEDIIGLCNTPKIGSQRNVFPGALLHNTIAQSLWGNLNFDHVVGPSVGFSGGILCVWDSCVFIKDHVSKSDYFVAIMGTWVPTSTKLLIISVYAPQELTEKRDLWNYLRSLIDRWDGETVIMGDFNEVRYEHERFGSTFNSQGANAFNNFISLAGLIDLPLEGYTFTWAHKSASKMSKLDRFLLSEGLFLSFPHLSALCLDRHLSDHRPILLKENSYDFGPTPFRIFHSWFSMEGFDSFVESTWKSMHVTDSNGLVRMKKKLQLLKSAIKVWIKETKARSYEKKINILQNLSEADKSIDRGLGNEEIILKRTKLLKELQELNYLDASEISQKAKVRWSIEGEENTKYFHGILNKKRSQLAIRGTLVNVEDLERLVTYDEVKRAVWDCGANKSPGPDGFTFEFFRKFWKTLDQDVFQAVSDFFENGHIPRGCNASFIALIPKIHDAKIVKDFRPISLIGSIYKIITKILANRLCNVLPCLISEVQSAFVSNRNILDGPFILDELLQWCKHKRKRAMIFKVDFEKAFDSVKWDYLIDTLRAFGFGQKWCSWINGCFETATGSVLVNGSPTSEFQFHRGLKQGDPISPFLFILIMETLHLSFKRVIEANLFKVESVAESWLVVPLFTPFKYLGVIVGDNMSRLKPWEDVILLKLQRSILQGTHNKWHDDAPFKSLYLRLHALETCKSISVASKLSQPSLIHSFRRPPRGGVEEEQFSLLGSRTTGISLPNMCDRWFWSLESSGDFSVKSTRICIDDNILPKNDVPTRWVKIIPIKVNIHAWKVFLDKLPTRLNLSLRGMDIPSILCPLCNSAAESTSHIFFSCPLARQVWNKFLRCRSWQHSVFLLNSTKPKIMSKISTDKDIGRISLLLQRNKGIIIRSLELLALSHYDVPTLAAVEEGLVVGGGCTLLRLAAKVKLMCSCKRHLRYLILIMVDSGPQVFEQCSKAESSCLEHTLKHEHDAIHFLDKLLLYDHQERPTTKEAMIAITRKGILRASQMATDLIINKILGILKVKIAITRKGILRASQMATNLIINKILGILKVNVLRDAILFLSKLCVSLASAIFTFLMLDSGLKSFGHNYGLLLI